MQFANCEQCSKLCETFDECSHHCNNYHKSPQTIALPLHCSKISAVQKEEAVYPDRSALKIIFKAKCPKCGQGDMFKHPNPYNLKHYDKMNRYCSNCNMDFENETGFYYGAMYVSYAFSISLSVINFIWTILAFGFGKIWIFLSINTAMLIILWPFIFRASRVLYLWMMDLMFKGEGARPDEA